MQFSEVKDSDMRMFGQLINMLQVGEYKLNGKDLCASADTIRWLQKLATDVSKSYSDSKASEKPSETKGSEIGPNPEGPKPPSQGLGEGVTIKAYSPGKMGKK